VADQSATGEIVFRTADTGIDGKTPVDLGDLDVVCIDALPSWVWYQEMPDSPRWLPVSGPGGSWRGPSRAGSLPPVQ
jgi:hypothetical protein